MSVDGCMRQYSTLRGSAYGKAPCLGWTTNLPSEPVIKMLQVGKTLFSRLVDECSRKYRGVLVHATKLIFLGWHMLAVGAAFAGVVG